MADGDTRQVALLTGSISGQSGKTIGKMPEGFFPVSDFLLKVPESEVHLAKLSIL